MAEFADRVVTELIADTSGHDPKIQTSARVVERSMSDIERSATRAEGTIRRTSTAMARSFDQTAMRSRLLGYQISDIGAQLASGTSPFLVLAQQGPQVANALEGTTGAAGRMASFFSGPWGAALLAAGTILATLALRHRDAGSASGEHERAERTLSEIIREQARAVQGLNTSTTEQIVQDYAAARSTLERAQAARQLTRELIRQAIAQAEAVERSPPGATVSEAAQAAELSARRVATLQGMLQQIEADLATAQGTMAERQIQFSQRLAEISTADAEAAANNRLEQSLSRLRAERRRGAITEAELRQRNADLIRQRDREIEQIRERERAERESRRRTGDERTLLRPATGGVLSQFGADRSGVRLNGGLVAGRRHQGVDIRGAIGDPVVAPEGGIATVRNAPGGLGLYVEIRADSGARNLLGHLSAARVQTGDRVAAGQLIGLIGDSGNARGGVPHLHWQRQVAGRWVDPMRGVGSSGAAQAARDALRDAPLDPQTFREHYELLQDIAALARQDGGILALTPDQIANADQLTADIEEMWRVAHDMPSLADGLLPREDQERLERFQEEFQRDLVGGLVEAIVQGESLGDTLVRTFQRAATELLTSGLLDLLAGRPFSNTLLGNLFGGGRVSLAGPRKFATGGSMILGGYGGGDTNVLSLNGEPIGMVGRGERLTITPQGRNPGTSAHRASAASPGPSSVTVIVNAQDAVLTHTVRGWIAQGMMEAAGAGASQGATAVTRNFSRARERAIP